MRQFSAVPRLVALVFCAGFVANAQASSDGPTIASFTPATISAHNGTTVLYVTAGDDGNTNIGVGFNMTLPAGLSVPVDSGGNIVFTNQGCSGTPTMVMGSVLRFQGTATPGGGACGFKITLTATQPLSYDSSADSQYEVADAGTFYHPAIKLRAVADAPYVTSQFEPAASVGLDGTTDIAIQFDNADPNFALTGAALTVTLPAGVIVASPNGLSSDCGGTATAVPGSSTLGFSGATSAVAGLCTFSATVQGTGAGSKTASVQLTANEIVTINQNVVLNVGQGVPVISWSAPAAIVYGTALDATQLNATASYNGNSLLGTFAYTPATGSVLNAGTNQALGLTFTPNDTTDYSSTNAGTTITVTPAPTTTALSTSCMTTFTDASPSQSFTTTATVTGTNPTGGATFSDSVAGTLCSGAVTLSGGSATCTSSALAAGTHQIGVAYDPDGNHTASTAAAPIVVTVLSAADAVFRNNFDAVVPGCPAE